MVILFDGVCNLCNGFVRFVIKRDKKKIFQFASLQSKYGTELSEHFYLPVSKPETIVLYNGTRILTESNAVIEIVSSLNGIWKCAVIFIIVPSFIRNIVYRLVAATRYCIFGKKEQCEVPAGDVKDRFLDDTAFLHGSI